MSAEELRAAAARDQFETLSSDELNEQMRAAVEDFLAALPGDGRRDGLYGWDDPERKDWDFWPSKYPGARLDRLEAEPVARADKLLRLGLSATGYEKVKLIRALEPYNPWLSPYYSVTVFDDDAGPLGWRFQGHHISLNFTIVDGEPAATTPLFLGSQPLSRADVAGGRAPLENHEQPARALYRSLDDELRRQAGIPRPPYTYLPERTPSVERQPAEGVEAADMTEEQRKMLWSVITAYVDTAAPAIAAERRREIEEAGLDEVLFGWAGSDQPGRDHYYRIQGPEFLIEYDSRDGGSHIHSVWRSFDGDFGEDLLRLHYASAHAASYAP